MAWQGFIISIQQSASHRRGIRSALLDNRVVVNVSHRSLIWDRGRAPRIVV